MHELTPIFRHPCADAKDVFPWMFDQNKQCNNYRTMESWMYRWARSAACLTVNGGRNFAWCGALRQLWKKWFPAHRRGYTQWTKTSLRMRGVTTLQKRVTKRSIKFYEKMNKAKRPVRPAPQLVDPQFFPVPIYKRFTLFRKWKLKLSEDRQGPHIFWPRTLGEQPATWNIDVCQRLWMTSLQLQRDPAEWDVNAEDSAPLDTRQKLFPYGPHVRVDQVWPEGWDLPIYDMHKCHDLPKHRNGTPVTNFARWKTLYGDYLLRFHKHLDVQDSDLLPMRTGFWSLNKEHTPLSMDDADDILNRAKHNDPFNIQSVLPSWPNIVDDVSQIEWKGITDFSNGIGRDLEPPVLGTMG